MKYYVFYEDGLGEENTGLEEFPSEYLAIAFINARIETRFGEDISLDDYVLIKGTQVELEAAKVVALIRKK